MPGPYTFPTNRIIGGPAPADDANGFASALNESTPDATPDVLVLRDASGRAKFVNPVADNDAATKIYVDDAIESIDTGGGGGSGKNWIPGTWGMPGVVINEGSSNEGTAANKLYLDEFKIDAPGTVTGICIYVQTAGTGNARLGIFKKVESTADTWTLVSDAGEVSIASTGEKMMSVSIALTEPGIYAAGSVYSSSITSTTLKTWHNLRARGSNTPFNNNLSTEYSLSHTYGALPASPTASLGGSFGSSFLRAVVRLS
jgi:hypothetical protein